MKIKKTIAAIAAATMVFTALPMAAFAEETPAPNFTFGDTIAVDNVTGTTPVTSGSTADDGTINVTVTLNPTDGDAVVTGQPENGTGRENYHVNITLTGLSSDWTFTDDSGYTYDNPTDATTKAWNITDNALKLWMPVNSGTCTIKLKNGAVTKTVVVKTVAHNHSYTMKHSGAGHWLECDCGSIKDGAVHSYTNGTCVCGAVDPATVVSSSGSSVAAPSTGAAVDTPAASAADMKTASKADVKVDASATKVTPAMVTAFVKNAKTETLTLEYGSTVKVAVAKEDLKDAAKANLDFSVSGKKILSDAAIKSNKTLANAAAIAQMNFVQEGKFNGIDKVTVKNRVGAKFVGQKATVYEYVDGKLVKVAETKVGGSGLVSFKIDHFGQYVIVVEKSAKGAVKKAATVDAK